jgi:hypothetical protein
MAHQQVPFSGHPLLTRASEELSHRSLGRDWDIYTVVQPHEEEL